MPRIQVNADVQSATGFPVWAEGTYSLRIKDVQNTTASTGKAQLKLQLESLDAEVRDDTGHAISNPRLTDFVTVDPVQGKSGGTFSFLRALWEAAGLTWGSEIDTDELVGRELKAKLTIDKDQKGNDRNRVRYIKA